MPNEYNIQQAIEVSTLALLIKREARGENYAAMLGVGWSVRNRVSSPRYWGHDWLSVMSHPEAYSSMVPPDRDNDPNLRVYLSGDPKDDLVIQAAEAAYFEVGQDPVHGATHYYDRSMDDNPPWWTKDGGSEHICDIGDFHFWKVH